MVIGEIKKNETTVQRWSIEEFKGKKRIDIRDWFKSGNDWKPSKKGTTISTQNASDLVTLAEKTEDALRTP